MELVSINQERKASNKHKHKPFTTINTACVCVHELVELSVTEFMCARTAKLREYKALFPQTTVTIAGRSPPAEVTVAFGNCSEMERFIYIQTERESEREKQTETE